MAERPTAPRARITPLPGDAAQRAFLSPARWEGEQADLVSAAGYRVAEATVAGEARLFAEGDVRPPRVLDRPAAYVTRALSLLPPDDARFSGVVHVELLNPSTGFDWPMYWPDTARHLTRRGDAYVGVTCKRVTADALRAADAERYGALAIEHDGTLWDLIGAVAAALRQPAGDGLLPGLRRPDRLLLTGWSQSGSFLRTYLSEGLHVLHTAELGHDVVDAYLIGVSSGGFGPMGYVNVDRDGEIAFDDDLRPLGEVTQIPLDDPRRVVRGAPVPVVELMSEDEAAQHLWHGRGDSDARHDRYRCYQLPGRGHESGLLDERDRAADFAALGAPPPAAEELPPRHAASAYVLAAVIDNLIAWTDGTPPPRADPIALTVDPGFQRDPHGFDYSGVTAIADPDGHALGGLRYLDLELPIRRMTADAAGPLTIKAWTHEPLPAAELTRRYGSLDDLRQLARRTAAELVAHRWLLPADADAAVAELCREAETYWQRQPT